MSPPRPTDVGLPVATPAIDGRPEGVQPAGATIAPSTP